jgi:hypothetical protein
VPSLMRGTKTEAAWKVNDRLSQKNGACHAIYWSKEVKNTDPLIRERGAKKKWAVGTTYKGEWKDNKKHGYGIQVWANGNKYEGDWANGFREGHGVFWVKDGKLRKQYAGNWRRGLMEGLGVFFYKCGDRYEGNWQTGMRQGRGTLFCANGDVYVGDWNQDKQSGFGTLTRENQDVYEGEWLNGKREGAGIYYYKSQEKIYDGEWVNDIPKCGVYTSSEEFFETDADFNEDSTAFPRMPRRKQVIIPDLRVKDPDSILAERIEEIQKQRQAVRNLPFIELEKLFSEEGLDDLRRIFSIGDSDGTGKIAPRDLKSLFSELGFVVTDNEVAALLVDLDKNASDTLDFSDFVKATHLVDEIKSAQIDQADADAVDLATNPSAVGLEYVV